MLTHRAMLTAGNLEYYLASSLENVEAARRLADLLDAAGFTCTYDWRAHGRVYRPDRPAAENEAAMRATAAQEIVGVVRADVLIVLLPGGRGTHVELGAALAHNTRVLLAGTHTQWDPSTGDASRNPCAFYYHPRVKRLTGATEEEVFTKVIHAMKMLEEWR